MRRTTSTDSTNTLNTEKQKQVMGIVLSQLSFRAKLIANHIKYTIKLE